jgi:hypothetical protein
MRRLLLGIGATLLMVALFSPLAATATRSTPTPSPTPIKAGDGVPHVVGPYSIDFSEITANDGTYFEKQLFTPTVGSIVLNEFFSSATAQDFTGAAGNLYIGQNGDLYNSGMYWTSWRIAGPLSGVPGWYDPSMDGRYVLDGQTNWASNPQIDLTSTDPVVAQYNFNGGSAPTAGHIDIYFEIVTPLAP